MTINKTFDRRTFLRGTTALAAATPFGGLLGSTAFSTAHLPRTPPIRSASPTARRSMR